MQPQKKSPGGQARARDSRQKNTAYSSRRTAGTQHLARHLHECGPRPVFEALLAIEAGVPLDEVLEGFARLPNWYYKKLGADILPIDHVTIIDGGAS